MHDPATTWRGNDPGTRPDESKYLHPLRSDTFHDWRHTIERWSTQYDVSWEAMRQVWGS